jgi:nitrogen fixation protein
VYLPREINSFIKRKRMNDLPLGVDIAYKYNGTPYYRVQSREDGKNICLGGYTTEEEAFGVYKKHKEGLAVKLAEKWKAEIPDVAYKALLNYTVEITD